MQPQRLNLEISNEDPPPPLSTLTRSHDVATTPRSRCLARRIEERDNVSLFQLANIPSPVQQRNHNQEEDEYDRRCYEENPGAPDSEEEPDVQDAVNNDVIDAAHPSTHDRAVSAEVTEAANLFGYVEVKEEAGTQPDVEPFCWGAPKGWHPPFAPNDWKPTAPKSDEPKFEDVDNPGGWSDFNFRPTFNMRGKYVRHQLPTGVTPCPIDQATGKRTVAGWEFHYGGWKRDENDLSFREGANKGQMFPPFRKGSLDQNRLTQVGLNAARMSDINGDPDSLFFYNLILPIHQINKEKGIEPVPDDPRQPFYANLAKYTNLYAFGELWIRVWPQL